MPLTTVISRIGQKETSRVEMQVEARKGSVVGTISVFDLSCAFHGPLRLASQTFSHPLAHHPLKPSFATKLLIFFLYLPHAAKRDQKHYQSTETQQQNKSGSAHQQALTLAYSEYAHPFDEKRRHSHVALDLSSLYHGF